MGLEMRVKRALLKELAKRYQRGSRGKKVWSWRSWLVLPVIIAVMPAGYCATVERKKYELKSRARNKPGTLLKHQVPIRTFSEWNAGKPGFLEEDLVGHDGGSAQGESLYSLDATDVASGWVETEALLNRAQIWTFQALERIRERLPFLFLGIDSDNDGVFINEHLVRYSVATRAAKVILNPDPICQSSRTLAKEQTRSPSSRWIILTPWVARLKDRSSFVLNRITLPN